MAAGNHSCSPANFDFLAQPFVLELSNIVKGLCFLVFKYVAAHTFLDFEMCAKKR